MGKDDRSVRRRLEVCVQGGEHGTCLDCVVCIRGILASHYVSSGQKRLSFTMAKKKPCVMKGRTQLFSE